MKRLLGALSAALAIGCTAPGEQVNPLAGGPPDAPMGDAGPADAGDGGLPEAGPIKRTVEQRNPFGNVAETENLLWDGDFEWYSPFADEYGWFEVTGVVAGLTLSDVRVGAACRSGLKCAALAKGAQIVGVAVASRGNKLRVSLWAHLVKGTCAQVTATLSDLDFKVDPNIAIHAVAADPDAGGWCHYDGVVDPRSHKPGLFVHNGTGAEVLIDDAVIKKVPSSMAQSALHGPLTAEMTAAIDAMQTAYAARRGPHDAPPSAARAAFEQWRAQ
jgi:hypothetical protein